MAYLSLIPLVFALAFLSTWLWRAALFTYNALTVPGVQLATRALGATGGTVICAALFLAIHQTIDYLANRLIVLS